MFLGVIHIREIASYLKNEKFSGELMEEYVEREKIVAIIGEWLQVLDHKGVGRMIMNLRILDYKRM